MVLNRYRDRAEIIILPMAKKMKGISPNALSFISFFSAVTAGLLFYLSDPFFVLTAVLFVFLSSFFDAMDGRVAKLTNQTSDKGDFLDHTLDRYADVFILGGIAFGSTCRMEIGLLAILGVLLTSYMGTQAHAVGVGRDYGGIAGRADRLVLLIIVPIVFFLLSYRSLTNFEIFGVSFTIIELMMVWFAIAGNYTALKRGVNTWNDLSKDE
ncbi:MAG: CDP-alcohol phosphatidyltransferase family protein [Thermoplasmatota archaeon]